MDGRILTCVYCGHEYPQDTPSHGDSVLTEHIKTCEKHPLRNAEQVNTRLRAALVGLIGSDDPAELLRMRDVIAGIMADNADKKITLNAIDTLLETQFT